jgi:triosephosphate isomerase
LDPALKGLEDEMEIFIRLDPEERRKYQQEDNQIISKKIITALNHKIIPILCVGEDYQVRINNDQENFVAKQILEAIDKSMEIKKLIIAYEPIWSIGTGKIATAQEISQMANFIKEFVGKNFSNISEFYLLYGGSVSSSNSAEILQIVNIDGLLVGGASLDANEFIAIANS